jgi:hypothetical protein
VHSRRRVPLALAGSSLLLLGLTACGGDDAGASGAGPAAPAADAPLSKAEYVTAAEAVCSRAAEEGTAIPEPSDPVGFAPYLQQTLDVAAKAVADLQALRPPEADAADLSAKFTGPLATQVELFRPVVGQIAEAAKAADPTAALDQVPTPEAPPADEAYLTAYGMPTCATFASSEG